MDRAEAFLENSAVFRALEMEARGESIDVNALARRQVLELVRSQQVAALDLLKAERAADEEMFAFLRQLAGVVQPETTTVSEPA